MLLRKLHLREHSCEVAITYIGLFFIEQGTATVLWIFYLLAYMPDVRQRHMLNKEQEGCTPAQERSCILYSSNKGTDSVLYSDLG